MENSSSTEPTYCVKCHLFYASKANLDMCSKCYKEEMKKGVEPANQPKAFGGSPSKPTAETSTSNKMDIEKPAETVQAPQEDKNKCYFCKKKTGIYGYQCKCGHSYCKMHRIPEDHECTFDFAAVGRQQLEKNNPLLVGKKLDQL